MTAPFRSLVLCGESRGDMEEWMSTIKPPSGEGTRPQRDSVVTEFLRGNHSWYATSHARPTYCNVCRDALYGKFINFSFRPMECLIFLAISLRFMHFYRSYLLAGVTSHGLSCEMCKYKVHKRCSVKAINNCKWTTLASIGKDIIEDAEGVKVYPVL